MERQLNKRYSLVEKKAPRDNFCLKHPKENLVSVCTSGKCLQRGAICPICQVSDHTEHLDKTWSLNHFIKQITSTVKELQPGAFEMNQFLVEFKVSIREAKNRLTTIMDKIDQQVNQMLIKIKNSMDKDIDDIKTIVSKLDKSNINDEFIEKIWRLTNYFGIDPKTHKIYRKNAYQELYKWKTTDLLYEQKDYFDKYSTKVIGELEKIEKKFDLFQIPQIEIVEVPKFQVSSVQCVQKIDAHHNWIRSVAIFHLSEKEVINMDLTKQQQMAEYDPYSREALVAVVTTSDDMDIKIWYYSPEDKKFHILQSIVGAHSREFFGLRLHYCDNSILSKISSQVQCNNLLFTSEHGLIKIWDWVQKKCINLIKTQSYFTYDFEILRFKELVICYASGSKNYIKFSDFTSPAGMFEIREINPEEQNKDIVVIRRIPQKTVDLLLVSFINSVVKIYNYQGICISKIYRQDQEMSFCMEVVKIRKRQNETGMDVLIIGSDSGIITAYDVLTGKIAWVNEKCHTSWIRALGSLIVKDNYNFKTILLTNSENDPTITMIDAATGQLLWVIRDALDSGCRYRSLFAQQGALEPRLPDSSIVCIGTSKGTLVILKVLET